MRKRHMILEAARRGDAWSLHRGGTKPAGGRDCIFWEKLMRLSPAGGLSHGTHVQVHWESRVVCNKHNFYDKQAPTRTTGTAGQEKNHYFATITRDGINGEIVRLVL